MSTHRRPSALRVAVLALLGAGPSSLVHSGCTGTVVCRGDCDGSTAGATTSQGGHGGHGGYAGAVFTNLSASTGVAAVQGVATFLARLDALEQHTDPARQDAKTKKDDAKAIELLAKRGLDADERARLHELVKVALGPTSPLPENPTAQANGENRKKALAELRGWYDEWATTAKAVVKKRGYLIRLGLATRKPPTKKAKAPQKPATAPAKPENGAASPAKPADAPAEPAAPK